MSGAVAIRSIVTDSLVGRRSSVDRAPRAADGAGGAVTALVGLHQRGAAIRVAVQAMAGIGSANAPARRSALAVGGLGIRTGLHVCFRESSVAPGCGVGLFTALHDVVIPYVGAIVQPCPRERGLMLRPAALFGCLINITPFGPNLPSVRSGHPRAGPRPAPRASPDRVPPSVSSARS